MKILARVNLSLPWHGAGAELYLHSVLRALVERGHECRVLARGAHGSTVLDGVVVEPANLVGFWRPDVVIGQLDDTHDARQLARRLGAVFVAIFHNHRQPLIYGHTPKNTDVGIWNSEWTRQTAYTETNAGSVAGVVKVFAEREIVVAPPIDADDYAIADDPDFATGYVTLVNLQPAKGVHQAIALAERRPDDKFMFVAGAYGPQVRPRLPNVIVHDQVPHHAMADFVYAQTRILLMPSDYESYGRCAVEAAHAGIPTIAHPTGGLLEALGRDGAGIFADRDRLDEWARVLTCLEDPGMFGFHSAAARTRAAALDPTSGYDAIERTLAAACA